MIVEVRRACKGCGITKSLADFYANAKGRFGKHSRCKLCLDGKNRESRNRFRAMGPVRRPEYKSCSMCRQTLPADSFANHVTNGDGLRTYCRECDKIVRRSGKYGLSRERVAEMLRQERCEACGVYLPKDRDKHIDHRHSDGAVRGVLCERCNTTLGKCDENPAVFMSLCDYLRRTLGVDYRTQQYSVTKINETDIDPVGDPESLTPEEQDKCQTKSLNP